jgi:hypothetical protein
MVLQLLLEDLERQRQLDLLVVVRVCRSAGQLLKDGGDGAAAEERWTD